MRKLLRDILTMFIYLVVGLIFIIIINLAYFCLPWGFM